MPKTAVLIGVPWDGSSSFMRGAAEAPERIRAALWSESTNPWTESGLDLSNPAFLEDSGDLRLSPEPAFVRSEIERAVSAVLDRNACPVVLGGDHSITYPVVRAFRDRMARPTVIHLDAHSDLYDEFDGDRFSHACPFARIMEEGLAARLIQIGIRTLTDHQRDQAARFGVEIFELERWTDAPPILGALTGPIYLSIDLDVLDPAFAPGVSHPEPGGLSTRDVLSLIHRLPAPVVGADIVEYNPANDFRDLTARVAAKLVKEVIANVCRR
jgi:agmatinase